MKKNLILKNLQRKFCKKFEKLFIKESLQDKSNKILNTKNEITYINQKLSKNSENYIIHSFSEKNSYGLKMEKNFNFLNLKKIKKNEILKIDDFFTNSENSENMNFSELFKKNEKEKIILNKKQLLTGNIGIDMTNPIFEGSFNFIKSDFEKKEKILKNIISQNFSKKFIYFSLKKKKLFQFEKLSKKKNLESIIITSTNSKTDLFLTLKLILKILKKKKNDGKEIIFILDDWQDFYYELFNLLRFDKSEIFLNFLREIFTLSNTTQNSNLTTLIFEDSQKNLNFDQNFEISKNSIKKEIFSLSQTFLDLNSEKIKYNKKNSLFGLKIFYHNSLSQNSLYKKLQYKLFKILINLKNEKILDKKFSDFKIEREIWDRYKILDAEYFLPIFLTNQILNFYQQILLTNFLIKTITNDNISYFDIEQEKFIFFFFDFLKNDKKFLNGYNAEEYLKWCLDNKVKEDEIFGALDFQGEEFFRFMKDKGFVRKFKKDYS